MNDFDDFGGSLANSDFQKETDYYDKQINAQKAVSMHSTKKIGGAKAVTIFKNISDDSFSSEEKLASIRYVLSMPTYIGLLVGSFLGVIIMCIIRVHSVNKIIKSIEQGKDVDELI